jgi:esterase/lipase
MKERMTAMTRHVSPSLFSRLAGWDGEVFRAMEHVRANTQDIQSPTLVLQARDDRVLSTKGLKLLRKWATHAESEVVLLPQGSHTLTRSPAKDEVFERIYRFAERLGLIGASE